MFLIRGKKRAETDLVNITSGDSAIPQGWGV
jgi:hypothetical protein